MRDAIVIGAMADLLADPERGQLLAAVSQSLPPAPGVEAQPSAPADARALSELALGFLPPKAAQYREAIVAALTSALAERPVVIAFDALRAQAVAGAELDTKPLRRALR